MNDAVVRRATVADVDAIVALIDEAQETGGRGLSQRMPPELVHGFLAALPCFVAEREGRLVGVLLAQPRPVGDEAGPVTRAMLDAYPGAAGSYVYGPVAVSREARGQGLARRLADALLAALPGREAILFIAEANAVSLRAHRRLGAREVAAFVEGGRRFRVFTLGGRAP